MGLRRTYGGPGKYKGSSALEKFKVIVPGPCEFFWGNVTYTGAGTPWLQLHDAAAEPAAGALALAVGAVAAPVAGTAGTGVGYIEAGSGLSLRTGAVLALSSTQHTYTAWGADEGIFLGTYN